jgi:diguanylate cyclase (GGDEF)-like protein/putative nucleotidyltransferase with HDIG domain
MTDTPDLSRLGRLYIGAVILAGLVVIGISVQHLYRDPIGYEWFLLAALTLISGSANVRLPGTHATISISETFVFTAVLLYGPSAGVLIVALDGLVISFWIAKRRRELFRVAFNLSAPALSAWCSANLFFYLADIQPLVREPAKLDEILPALVVFALTYFGINSWLIAFIIAMEKRANPFVVWRKNLLWLSLNYFCGASVAVLIVVYNRSISLGYLGLIVPLLLVLYFTFRTAMARAEDTTEHLARVNALYLSTIETLAMAIDAKDQITHGHIRRVQLYAVRLAHYIGVKDEHLIKAIEAAALLHDMGKLAVPEYILNKPGRLTASEFEKMKLHATVGADILSAIDFPYPVVPIVRHHHENWDGTGYPAGLKGTDIPIGARLLAVVDCFDALTSDRPYRPRLSSDEALSILFERRGTMYDPLIVDTFASIHSTLVEEASESARGSAVSNQIATAIQVASPASVPRTTGLENITSGTDEMLTLYELAGALAGQASVSDTADVLTKHLRRLVPFSLCVVYIHDPECGELVARHCVGEVAIPVNGIRIPLGQRLSGWVAAHRQTIVNSDPTLDFGEIARCSTPRLRSCMSVPLVSKTELIGVLTLYSITADGFTDDHRRTLEAVARQTSHSFRSATEFEDTSRRDDLTGLPTLEQLSLVLRRSRSNTESMEAPSKLILIGLANLKEITKIHGLAVSDAVLRHVARQLRLCLGTPDLLFRYNSDEFIALFDTTDDLAIRQTAELMRRRVRTSAFDTPDGKRVFIDLDWSVVTISDRCSTVEEAIREGRRAMPGKSTPHVH